MSSQIVGELLGESLQRRLTGGEILLLIEEASASDLDGMINKLVRKNIDYQRLQNRVDGKQFAPDDIQHIAEEKSITTLEVLKNLYTDGLELLTGKSTTIINREWVDICEEASFVGLNTLAVMTISNNESCYDRVEKILRLRESQDKTKCYVGCIVNMLHNDHDDYMKMVSITKIAFDNFPA
jgi:2-iminoacetate synthase ThiH